jgi:hypothetical protein
MKTSSIVILLLMMIYVKTNGQLNVRKCNIREYSNYINHAEIAIVDNAYEKAIQYFDSAFQKIEIPFAKDKYNATVCYALTGNFEQCKSEIIYLLGKGLDKKMISDNEAFNCFLLSEIGEGILDLEIEPTYNVKLRDLYDSIVSADQFFRRLDHMNAFKLYSDTICKIDSSNVTFMNELINKYGWPTEDLIGIEELNGQQYEIVLIHQRNSKYQLYDYTEDVKRAYENCFISADKAQYLLARINGSDECKILDSGFVTIVYDSLGTFRVDSLPFFKHEKGFIRFSENKTKDVDMKRKVAGIETLEEFRRKLMYSLKDKRFIFHYYGGKSIWTYPVKADYDFNSNILITY